MIYFDKRWKQTQHLSASCSFKQILARWCLQFKLVFTLFLQNNCKAFFLLQSMQQQAWSSCSWRNIWLFLSLLKCFSVTGESFSKSLTQSIFHYIYWLWTPPPVSLQKAIQNHKPAGDCAQKMASAEAQQGTSLPTIVLIDEKYDPFTGLFALLQSLKFLSAEVPWDVRTVI